MSKLLKSVSAPERIVHQVYGHASAQFIHVSRDAPPPNRQLLERKHVLCLGLRLSFFWDPASLSDGGGMDSFITARDWRGWTALHTAALSAQAAEALRFWTVGWSDGGHVTSGEVGVHRILSLIGVISDQL